MNPKTLIITLLLLFPLMSFYVGDWGGFGQAYAAPDPRTDPDGYRRWCENQGGYVDWSSGNPACVGIRSTPPVQTRSFAELEAQRRASQHWDNKNWAQAITQYQLALSYCRFSCDAYRQNITWATVYFHETIGDRYWDQKNWSEVIRAYQQALVFCAPGMDCGWLQRDISRAMVYRQGAVGGSYFKQENWLEAIDAYDAALRLCIPSMDCNWIRNSISAAKENHKNQIARIGRNTWAAEGSRHWDDKNWPAAISAYKEALSHCNSSMDCGYLRDNISRGNRNIQTDRAHRFIEERNWEAADVATRAAWGFCNSRVSCTHLVDLVANARSDYRASEGDKHWRTRNWEAAIRDYKAALAQCTPQMNCGYLEDNLKRATKNFENQDFASAGEAFNAGNLEKALEFYNKALEKDDPSWALDRKGYILSQMGRNEEALVAYSQAYQKDPSNLNAAWNLLTEMGAEDIDEKIILLENSILKNTREADPEFYDQANVYLEDLKDRRSSFFYDTRNITSTVFNFISSFFNSSDGPEGELPNVSMDQLIQARDHGKLAVIEANEIDDKWMLTVKPEISKTALENASFEARMVFDRGKNYNPNEIIFSSNVPDIKDTQVPDIEGVPVEDGSEVPGIDLSIIPPELKSRPRWRRFEQQAALLGQDYTKQKNTLEELKAKAPALPEASPERQEVEKAIEQTETDLVNTKGSMKKVEKKMMDFFISFKENPKPADREEEK